MKNSAPNYFQGLNHLLQQHERSIPCLLIDLNRLDANIKTLKSQLPDQRSFRIVVKSLPSFQLLNYIIERTDSTNLMVFHQPFLSDLSRRLDHRFDLLLGKPMPIKTAHYYFKTLVPSTNGFSPFRQIQWLVDSSIRIGEYIALAKGLDKIFRLNLEIDVGLHRGGFSDLQELRSGLQLIQQNSKWVKLSGLMGYDPQVVKLPRLLRSQQRAYELANQFYAACKELIRNDFPDLWTPHLVFNGAGSPTLSLHQSRHSPLNDLAAGSCLVKPSTFDIPTLRAYQPACFIATPILKKRSGTLIPGLESYNAVLQGLFPHYRQSLFIYGGNWLADYCYPIGCRSNWFMGASTNQSMVNLPAKVPIEVDDFIFLRPQQSEFVFLQFGQLLPFRGSELLPAWDLLHQA